RPLGPRLTFTASARVSTPRSMHWRASWEKLTSLAAILAEPPNSGGRGRSHVGLEHAHDVRLLHDQQVFPVDLDFSSGPLYEHNAVADLHVERHDLALLITGA